MASLKKKGVFMYAIIETGGKQLKVDKSGNATKSAEGERH